MNELWDTCHDELKRVFAMYASAEAGTALTIHDFLAVSTYRHYSDRQCTFWREIFAIVLRSIQVLDSVLDNFVRMLDFFGGK
jgi:hypothetical protein